MKPQCEFSITLIKDGRVVREVARMFNTTLYTGYDLLAAMATSGKYLNGMYLEYQNTPPLEPTISPTRDRSYYAALENPGATEGYVRVPIALDPIFSSTAAEYQSNKATLTGVSDPVKAGDLDIIDGTTQFFTVALVHMPDIGDPSQDIVYNAAPMYYGGSFTPVPKVANVQIGVQASIKFEATP